MKALQGGKGQKTMQIRFTILGNPMALKRHRSFRAGRFIRTYDPNEKAKENFLKTIQDKAPERPIDKPIELQVDFYFARPKNHYRTGKFAGRLKDNAPAWHISRPDLTNLVKFVEDSLNGIFWRDDSTIARVRTNKLYSDKPRTEIIVEELGS